jgi:cellulose synthase/poly-beta-1,6-N-acetylglucosamine synthase-like glycosyltransferase
MNLMKLGESKECSTIFFEGGFSAFKREMLDGFDPYNTGSDDCGTVIRILENGARAIMVPEAEFFTTFPRDWSSKVEIKVRRSVQIVKLLTIYANLLVRNQIKSSRGLLYKNLLLYLVAPVMFLFFITSITLLALDLPLLVLVFGVFVLVALLIPRLRGYLMEVTLNYAILLYSMFLTLINRKSVIWRRPPDRLLLTEEMLLRKDLI